jgi:hypothetical protein
LRSSPPSLSSSSTAMLPIPSADRQSAFSGDSGRSAATNLWMVSVRPSHSPLVGRRRIEERETSPSMAPAYPALAWPPPCPARQRWRCHSLGSNLGSFFGRSGGDIRGGSACSTLGTQKEIMGVARKRRLDDSTEPIMVGWHC